MLILGLHLTNTLSRRPFQNDPAQAHQRLPRFVAEVAPQLEPSSKS
jgi:hypothetical protein